jgi:hypothetical protein
VKLWKSNRGYVLYAIGECFQVAAITAVFVLCFQYTPTQTFESLERFAEEPLHSAGNVFEKHVGHEESTGIVKHAVPPPPTKSLR